MHYQVGGWMLLCSMIQPPPFIDDFELTALMYNFLLGFSIILVIALTIIVGWLLKRIYPSPKLTGRDYAALTAFIGIVFFACAPYCTPLASHSPLVAYLAAVFGCWYLACRSPWWKKR